MDDNAPEPIPLAEKDFWTMLLRAIGSGATVVIAIIGWLSVQYLSGITTTMAAIAKDMNEVKVKFATIETTIPEFGRRIEKLENQREFPRRN